MKSSIYIRPLQLGDARESFHWRNNPRIWRLTGSRPSHYVTVEMETEWIETVLKREDEKRFAICLKENDRYIGNIFLTHIKNGEAYIHIFIGELEYWGEGRALSAVMMVLNYAFNQLQLQTVLSDINQKNLASISLAKSAGFKLRKQYFNEENNMNLFCMMFTKEMFHQDKRHHQFV